MVNNRIEEVKKILNEFEEENQHFRGIFCTMYDALARQICQLFPQPLDDKELGEKMKVIITCLTSEAYRIYSSHLGVVRMNDALTVEENKRIDQILALLQQKMEEAWELQDTLMELTALNQNAPKIVLTNDECGWYATYYPNPPNTEGEVSVLKGNPLEAIKDLKQALKGGE